MLESINNQSMLKVGTILHGTYRIDSYLSSGGFGNTYVATNVEFDERVAIKEFFMKGVTQRADNQTTVSVSNLENTNSFQEQKEKFKKEARRLRKMQNEHLVRVHDMFDENGTTYYVMDYVDGENLSEWLKRTGRPMTESEVRLILPQILDALKAVHNEGFCHLDIKPSNIMLEKGGKIKLIDFGASKQLGANGTLTTNAPTAFAQTPGYAPREQMEQNLDKIGPWTDIYALGATLYNLLTNNKPPLPTDIDDDMSEDKHNALPFPESVGSLRFLILKMMKTNRLQRPHSVTVIDVGNDQEQLPSYESHYVQYSNCVESPWNTGETDEQTLIVTPQQKKEEKKAESKLTPKVDTRATLSYILRSKKRLVPFIIMLVAVLTGFTIFNPLDSKKEVGSEVEQDPILLEQKVVGRHPLMLDRFIMDYFGTCEITKTSDGKYRCIGSQKSNKNSDYLKLDGYISIINDNRLRFTGMIKTMIHDQNDGNEDVIEGTFDFVATNGEQYWRFYGKGLESRKIIDIYFSKRDNNRQR